jgi:hypothetical protein
MRSLFPLASLVLLAACSQPQTADTATPVYDADHLASSPACFAEDRAALLAPGQVLLERGPDGMVRISSALGHAPENLEFSIAGMPESERQVLDAAAADFFRAAGIAYDPTTDTVIYHRATDGTFCTVTNSPAIGEPLVAAARALAAPE